MKPVGGKKRAAKHIAIYSVGTIIRQLASFIMLPIYTSYLSPADYGVVGLLVVMVSLFELLLGARFAAWVPKFYYETNDKITQSTVVSTALFITAASSIIATVIVAAASTPISSLLFGSVKYSSYVAIYGVMLFTMAIESYGLTFLRLQERPYLFIANSIIKLVVQLSLNILFVVHFDMGVFGVVISGVISSSASAIFAAIYILHHTGFLLSGNLSVRLFKFCWPLWLGGLAGLYIGSSNRFFIRIFGDLDQVGLFELATKFSAMLAMLIWDPFSQWWQTERFKIYRTEDNGVTVFPVVFNGMSCIMLLAAAGIAIFSQPVILLMADASFHSAAGAVPILAFAVLVNNLTGFFFFSFLVTEKTIYITYIRYFSAAVITIFYFLLIPPLGYIGAAWALMAANTVVLIASYLLSKRFFDNGINLRFLFLLSVIYSLVCIADQRLLSCLSSVGELVVAKLGLYILLLGGLSFIVRRDEKLGTLYLSAAAAVGKKYEKIKYSRKD